MSPSCCPFPPPVESKNEMFAVALWSPLWSRRSLGVPEAPSAIFNIEEGSVEPRPIPTSPSEVILRAVEEAATFFPESGVPKAKSNDSPSLSLICQRLGVDSALSRWIPPY